MGAQVLDHGRIVSGALVAQLALERLLTCEEKDVSEHGKWDGYVGDEGASFILIMLNMKRKVDWIVKTSMAPHHGCNADSRVKTPPAVRLWNDRCGKLWAV